MAGGGMGAGLLSASPLRFQEKGNLEVLLFSIQSKLRACNRRLFVPREGCGIWDIDKVRLRMWARGWAALGSLCRLCTAQGSHSHCGHHGLDVHSDSYLAIKDPEEATFFSNLHRGAVSAGSDLSQRSQGY